MANLSDKLKTALRERAALNGNSPKLKSALASSIAVHNDPLDAAEEALKRLKGSDDWDEITKRTTLPELHVHVTQPSQPDVEPEPKRSTFVRVVLSLAVAAAGAGALAKAIAEWLAGRH